MSRIIVAILSLAVLTIPPACTWVPPTTEGEAVRVASADAVSACERLGKVTVSVKSRVSGVERKPDKVAKELATLARNEGATMGGDTVVAESDAYGGRQVFGVYRCAG